MLGKTFHKSKLLDALAYIDEVEGSEEPYEVVVRRPQKPRSLKENNYYWGVIIDILSNESGEDPDRIHHFLRDKFLRIDSGGIIPKSKSTAELSTAEAEDYYSKIRMWASGDPWNIYIPKPNEPYEKITTRID